MSFLEGELPGKRLQFLKETVPQSTRIAVLWNPVGPGYAARQSLLHNLTVAARDLELHLHVVEVRRADELATAFAALSQARADALFVLGDALVLSSTRLGGQLADLTATYRLPAMYSWRDYVEAGGLMSYGPSLQDIYRRAATYVDKILKGAKPADLPIEQATKFELVINMKTAQAIGLLIPLPSSSRRMKSSDEPATFLMPLLRKYKNNGHLLTRGGSISLVSFVRYAHGLLPWVGVWNSP